MKNKLIYDFFSDDDFLRISSKIREVEKNTSGEIRVSIKGDTTLFDRKKNIRSLAEKEFYKLNMHSTRDNTGILLFLLLTKRKFYILADKGINEKVDQFVWDGIRDEMQKEFREGHFSGGMILGLDRVGKILSQHFPIKSDDTNELSNRIIVN